MQRILSVWTSPPPNCDLVTAGQLYRFGREIPTPGWWSYLTESTATSLQGVIEHPQIPLFFVLNPPRWPLISDQSDIGYRYGHTPTMLVWSKTPPLHPLLWFGYLDGLGYYWPREVDT